MRDTTRVRTTEALTVDGSTPATTTPKVDLWDRSWPGGRYYWTVVPVHPEIDPGDGKVIYRETELPQDACSNARVLDFGKGSVQAAPVGSTGLSPNGRLVSTGHVPTVLYGPPLVAWTAAPAATKYEIQWGHATKPTRPWRPTGHIQTPATSVMLPLSPGTWRYRVRGINESLPGNQNMTWSGLTSVRIAKPTFRVTGG